MFSQRLYWLALTFTLLFFSGAALANAMFVYMSLVMLFFIVLSLLFERPAKATVRLAETRKAVWDNDTAIFTSSLTVPGGLGLIAVSDTLPEFFSLEAGNNFHLYAKGPGAFETTVSYTVRCTRRGAYSIGTGNLETIHFSGLEQTEVTAGTESIELVVRPRPTVMHRIRDPRVISQIPMPIGARSRIGMMTTDFREIRTYVPGDPYRSINWRATVKLSQAPDSVPLVNDFEKEGRKTVWIFLDVREWMGAGSSVENAFEYAVQAALGVSQFYLSRSCSVGVSFYNCYEQILPDTGRRQTFKIARRLIDVEIFAPPGSCDRPATLSEAVEAARGHLAGTNPYFVVITMIDPRNARDLSEGIRFMRKFQGGSRTVPQVMILHIRGHDLSPEGDCEIASAALVDLRNAPLIRAIRKAGAFVVPWNPQSGSLLKVMTVSLKRRLREV